MACGCTHRHSSEPMGFCLARRLAVNRIMPIIQTTLPLYDCISRPLDILAQQAYPSPMKPKDPLAEYVRKLASAGRKARKNNLTAKRRKAIAKKAERARWSEK